MLILEGKHISRVVEQILLKDVPVYATLEPMKSLKFYKIDKKLICVYDQEDISNSGEILNEMTSLLNISRVSTINVLSKSQYKTGNPQELDESFVITRAIGSEFKHMKELKSPNFIAGLSAGGKEFGFRIYNVREF